MKSPLVLLLAFFIGCGGQTAPPEPAPKPLLFPDTPENLFVHQVEHAVTESGGYSIRESRLVDWIGPSFNAELLCQLPGNPSSEGVIVQVYFDSDVDSKAISETVESLARFHFLRVPHAESFYSLIRKADDLGVVDAKLGSTFFRVSVVRRHGNPSVIIWASLHPPPMFQPTREKNS